MRRGDRLALLTQTLFLRLCAHTDVPICEEIYIFHLNASGFQFNAANLNILLEIIFGSFNKDTLTYDCEYYL